jgi:DNA (cytosine-5)-methyltransferase 1
MTRPVLIDLFCKAGGATRGYQQAGFYVIGVDIEPQPHYIGEEFIQADALDFLDSAAVRDAAAIHASPVCKGHANVTRWRGDQSIYPDTLNPALAKLARLEVPWVVENVPEALPAWDLILCGSNFGLQVRRHRGFRFGNWSMFELLPPCQHRGLRPFMHKDERAYADAMRCTWMTKEEARQAIPPAYTEHIGRGLLEHVTAVAA